MNSIQDNLIEHWNNLKKKPKVIVFDLDFTLWPVVIDYFAYNEISANINEQNEIELINETGIPLKPFQEVTLLLKTLKETCLQQGQYLAVASRASNRELALKAIDLYGWTSHFSSFQIHPGSKVVHMNDIKHDLRFDKFSDVLFFDDDHRNIIELNAIGIVAHKVDNQFGLTIDDMLKGLTAFSVK